MNKKINKIKKIVIEVQPSTSQPSTIVSSGADFGSFLFMSASRYASLDRQLYHKVRSTYRWPSTNIHTRNLHALLYSSPWTCPLKPQPLDKWAEPTSTLNPLLGGKISWGRFSLLFILFCLFVCFCFYGVFFARHEPNFLFVLSPHIFF